jgi:hypothetical protein
MLNQYSKYFLAGLLLFCTTQIYAFDILINGFGTVCASKSDLPKEYNNILPAYPFLTQLGTVAPFTYTDFLRPGYVGAERRWNFLPNSKFGLQVTSIFSPQYKAVVQIIGGAEYMTNNNFVAMFDWAYLQYNYSNLLDFQFGRFPLPTFYYSDYIKVNHAQPWVMPPQEVYFLVGGAFTNANGIKARYSYYFKDWTIAPQVYFGSMQENLIIMNRDLVIKVRDLIGGVLQIENDYLTLRGSVLRSIYDSDLNNPLLGLVSMTNRVSGTTTPEAVNFANTLQSQNVPIIYVGLALAFNFLEDFNLLVERASIMSRGIITTAREGYYGALTYSWRDFAFTFTYGYSRPLQTEVNKYNAANAFFQTPQYLNFIDMGSGAGAAVVEQFRSYLGRQRSYMLDIRYDVLPSLALKGEVEYIVPTQKGPGVRYILNRVATVENVWVYRASFDFVF